MGMLQNLVLPVDDHRGEMINYILKRLLYMIFTILLLSVVVFLVIQLPPGDFLTTYIASIQAQGTSVDPSQAEMLKREYGLDKSLPEQYGRWFFKFIQGDLGPSFQFQFRPVSELLAERLPYTILLSLMTLIFTYLIAVPIGIYAATHQYSFADYALSVIGFAGLATPNFMLALILMYILFRYFNLSVGGLFSPEFASAPWSLDKIFDLARHMILPILVIGLGGTAGIIRVCFSVTRYGWL
jgi:peptide/nickel transport system permease protein